MGLLGSDILSESRVSLYPGLGGISGVAVFSIVMTRLSQTESVVFELGMFSVFLRKPLLLIIYAYKCIDFPQRFVFHSSYIMHFFRGVRITPSPSISRTQVYCLYFSSNDLFITIKYVNIFNNNIAQLLNIVPCFSVTPRNSYVIATQ